MIKLFSVDDSNQFLDAINIIFLPYSSQFEVVGRYGELTKDEDVEELIETIQDARPDIVLMDFDFQLVKRPADFGIELTRLICKKIPSQKIIMLTQDSPFTNDEVLTKVSRSFQAGAVAYLRKDEMLSWFGCIQETAKSKPPVNLIPETVVKMLVDRLQESRQYSLTDREIEAINHLANDKKVREIADAMGIKFDGANFHLDNAKIKLGVRTLQGLVAKSLRQGLIV